MESDSEAEESQYFRGIRESRQSDHRHNVTRGGQEVAWLNAKRGRVLGPNTSMEVMEGDSVELSVFAKYEIPRKRVNRASLFPRSAARKLATDLGDIVASGSANPFTLFQIVDLIAEDLQQKPAPEAYLGYALYDSDSVLYEKGKRILSKKAANNHEELREKLYISKTGYIETFLVNETNEDVWFDDFSVMSISSILVQETHYDPWGLELKELGFQAGGIKVNKYLYNGKEYIEDNGLQFYDYGARMYDPSIGRWSVFDPMASYKPGWTPYRFGFNNPIRFVDPNGLLEIDQVMDIFNNAPSGKSSYDADGNCTCGCFGKPPCNEEKAFREGPVIVGLAQEIGKKTIGPLIGGAGAFLAAMFSSHDAGVGSSMWSPDDQQRLNDLSFKESLKKTIEWQTAHPHWIEND